ncbi:MAG: YdcF family protein [Gammaproteobacteria bacterium]|nr:YdcF family protein [Gammaproteobacteria bacterium]MBV9621401.1 YdcF family protein [Gammaproteobacteria bacterium]
MSSIWLAAKGVLRTLVLPPAGPLLIAAAGLVLLARGRARRSGFALLLAGLASLWLLATPLIADQLWRAVARQPPLDVRGAGAAQAIVILGGGSERRHAPEYGFEAVAGAQLLERVAYGAYVARRTHLPLAVSGTTEEVEAMRATLRRDFGLEVRWAEGDSRDTFDNARYCARLLQPQGVTRLVLVTSASHVHRAAAEFRSAGFTVWPAPVGIWAAPRYGLRFLPTSGALDRSSEALYELLGDVARRTLAALHLRRQRPEP